MVPTTNIPRHFIRRVLAVAANSTTKHMKSLITCFSVLLLTSPVLAGPTISLTIRQIESAPALVVATVESVSKQEEVPGGKLHSGLQQYYYDATLRVHRAFANKAFGNGTLITIRYIAYNISGQPVLNNPGWLQIEKGFTALFPLKQGDSGKWKPLADAASNLIVPAIPRQFSPRVSNQSGRSFILGELANALANGRTTDRYAAALYLNESVWTEEFREILARKVGLSDDRWTEVTCALLATRGMQQPTLKELLVDPHLPGVHNQAAAWGLARVAKSDYPDRLIRGLLRNMHDYEWGASYALLDFKDSPLLIHELKSSLLRDVSGSIYCASVLIYNGQRSFLPEALTAAAKLVNDPGPVSTNRLYAASTLLRDNGTDQQFEVLLASLRRLKTENQADYGKLYGSVSDPRNKRELMVANVIIDDRRVRFGTLRYCDLAATTVEYFSGEKFGIKRDMTLVERDRAVALAAAWLKRHLGKS